MSVKLNTMTAALRGLLLDQVGLPLWSDGALQQALLEAVAEHSFLFPRTVRQVYAVSAGQTAIALIAADSSSTAGAGGLIAPSAPPLVAADILTVQRVELPPGTPLLPDPRQISDPANSGSQATAYANAWIYNGGWLYLRNAASGLEVGSATCVVDLLQTYTQPDSGNTLGWDGPVHDLPLLYLLAQRAAYQQVGGWAGRDDVPKGGTVANWPAIVASLEVAIARAITTRQGRGTRSRTLDI